MKNFCFVFLGFIFSLNAWGQVDPSNPGLPTNIRYPFPPEKSLKIGITKIADRYVFMPVEGGAWTGSGSFWGSYDSKKNNAAVSVLFIDMFITLNESPSSLGGANRRITSGVYFSTNGGYHYNFVSLDLPTRSGYGSVLYNRVKYFPATYANFVANFNSQEIDNYNGVVLAKLLLASEPVRFVRIDIDSVGQSYPITNPAYIDYLGDTSSGMLFFMRAVPLLPVILPSIQSFGNGVVKINTKGVLTAVPSGCLITQDKGMACPFDVSGQPASMSYLFKGVSFRPAADDAATAAASISGATPAGFIYYSAAWLDSQLLKNQTSVVLTDYNSLSLTNAGAGVGSVSFDQFTQLTIERANSFEASITERILGGVYSGIVGQSDITIPYAIKLSGDSKASFVTVKVDGPPTTKAGVSYCGFKTNTANAQTIAVPLSLKFYKPNQSPVIASTLSDCRGIPSVIDNGLWSDVISANGVTSELWLDMVFNLTSDIVQTDTLGNQWQGTASADGSITVDATWN